MNLDDAIYTDITRLCDEGESLVASGQCREALRLYYRSWSLLPEPKEEWDAATWILAAIGDAHFALRDFKAVLASLSNAIHCPGGLGNPFIHLRLGEAAFELGDFNRANDELTRAYMGAGEDIFSGEDPKYLLHLKAILQPMSDHDDL